MIDEWMNKLLITCYYNCENKYKDRSKTAYNYISPLEPTYRDLHTSI